MSEKALQLLLPQFNSMPDVIITGLSADSRQVNHGDCFFAYAGCDADGRDYIEQAISKGAVVILKQGAEHRVDQMNQVPVITVPKLSTELGNIAARFYDLPSSHMRTIGVTGTNGKTSIAYYIAQLLQKQGLHCGLIGTLGIGFPDQALSKSLTTPDAISLQASLARFKQAGAGAVVMEASSHGLDQGRLNGVNFDIAIFTNLSRDHLDYHGDMRSYGAAKQKLFHWPNLSYAVINADDPFGEQLLMNLPKSTKAYAYSLCALELDFPLVHMRHCELNLQGFKASIATPWGEGELVCPLLGRFNISNALAVLTSLLLCDVPLKDSLALLSKLQPAPGRMQTAGGDKFPLVVVDYAHTPDALQHALTALKEHCIGHLHCVFGCGGDRDKGKRATMGRVAEEYSNKITVTNDNPRHEDPMQIVDDICGGLREPKQAGIELDRAKAITTAIEQAKPGDIVLIAGKGHEQYQQILDQQLPFNDMECVRNCLTQLNQQRKLD